MAGQPPYFVFSVEFEDKQFFSNLLDVVNKDIMEGSEDERREVAGPPTNSEFAFAFDIDGVLLRSSTPLPGASQVLNHLVDNKIGFIFLTNSGGSHETKRVEKLTEQFEVPLLVDQFVQSHTPFRNLVPYYKNDCVLVIGGIGNACREVAEQYGFNNIITSADVFAANSKFWPFSQAIERNYYSNFARPLPKSVNPSDSANSLKVSAILVFNSSRDWGMDAQLVFDLLISQGGVLGTKSPIIGNPLLPNNGWQRDGQPKLFFANPDFEWATDYQILPRFGQGAFKAALEGIVLEYTQCKSTLEKTMVGKPYHASYEYGENVLNNYCVNVLKDQSGQLKRVYMIGDNCLRDIKGANEYESPHGTEWKSILVETGVYAAGSQPAVDPTTIVKDVKAAVNWAFKQEGMQEMP